MQCAYPVSVVTSGEPKIVPCKRCIPCRINRQAEVSTRLFLETFSTVNALGEQSSLFVTFTYTDESIPEGDGAESVMRNDLRHFFKRLQHSTGQKTRYFCIGERGSNTNRLHAHALIFGLSVSSNSPTWFNSKKNNVHFVDSRINGLWTRNMSKSNKQYLGRCLAAPVTLKSMRYLSRYGLKDTIKGDHVFSMFPRKPALGTDGAVLIRQQLEKTLGEDKKYHLITHLNVRDQSGKKYMLPLDTYTKSIVNEGSLGSLDILQRTAEAQVIRSALSPEVIHCGLELELPEGIMRCQSLMKAAKLVKVAQESAML